MQCAGSGLYPTYSRHTESRVGRGKGRGKEEDECIRCDYVGPVCARTRAMCAARRWPSGGICYKIFFSLVTTLYTPHTPHTCTSTRSRASQLCTFSFQHAPPPFPHAHHSQLAKKAPGVWGWGDVDPPPGIIPSLASLFQSKSYTLITHKNTTAERTEGGVRGGWDAAASGLSRLMEGEERPISWPICACPDQRPFCLCMPRRMLPRA